MKIHHKNMKQVSHDMQQWVQSNLSHLGVYECTYNHFNIENGSFMPIPMHYNWYCKYIEEGFDLNVATRLNEGAHYWDESHHLFKAYKAFVGKTSCYKLDMVVKTENSYELMILAGTKRLSPEHYSELRHKFHILSHMAERIRKEKPNTVVELRPFADVAMKHRREDTLSWRCYRKRLD